MSDLKDILTSNHYTLDKSCGKGTLCSSYMIVNNTNKNNYFGKVYTVDEIKDFINQPTNFQNTLENERKIYQAISEIDDFVHFIGLIVSPQTYVFVTEYYGYDTLKNIITSNSNKPMRISTIIDILHKIVLSIHKLHSRNITHKNLKLSNVLISQDNQLKLSDIHLGCSLFLYSKYQQIARSHMTLQYLGPELFTNKKIDEKIDIWPIGIIGLEMISGINKVSLVELSKSANKVVSEEIKKLDNEGNTVNDVKKDLICDFILKCLNIDLNKRSSSVELVNHQLFKDTPSSSVVAQKVVKKVVKKAPIKSDNNNVTKTTDNMKTDDPRAKPIIQTAKSSVKTVTKSDGKKVVSTVKTTKTISRTVNTKNQTKQTNTINITNQNTIDNNNTNSITVSETTLIVEEKNMEPIDEPKRITPNYSEPQEQIIIVTNNYVDTTSIITELINKINSKQITKRDAASEYLNLTDRNNYFPNDDESRNKLIDCTASENRTTLDVSGTKFGNMNINYVKSFFDIMKMQSHLKEVNFFMCLIGNDYLHDLYLSMTYLVNLESINLNCNYINDKFVIDLSNHFKYMSKISVLKLGTDSTDDNGDHKIHDNGLQILSANLKYVPSLEVLHLNGHNFTSIGFSDFCKCLPQVPNLTDIKLGENKLNDGAVDNLAKSFKYITKLENLELRDNAITNEGLHSLGNNLVLLKSLKVLYIHKNPLNDKQYLQLLMKKHKNVKIHTNFSTEMKTSSQSSGCLII